MWRTLCTYYGIALWRLLGTISAMALGLFGIFFLLVLVIGLVSTVLWVLAIIEVLTKESDQGNTKIIWLLVIFFGHILGALLYYFIRRPERIATLGR